MSIHISRQAMRRKDYGGRTRYTVGFPGVAFRQFVIESPPRPQTREWQRLFTRALGVALAQLEEELYEVHERRT